MVVKRIRIAYVINSLRMNGPSRVLINMIKGINREEFEVTLITLIDENDSEALNEISDVELINMNYRKSIKTLLMANKLTKYLEKRNFDIIHTHTHIPAMMVSRYCGIKINTVHNRLLEDFSDTYGKKAVLINYLYVMALKKCDRVICCSESSWNVVVHSIPGAIYIRNGIDCNHSREKFTNIRRELRIPQNAIVYIYVGTLSKLKNVTELISKFSTIMDEREYLLVLGDGPLKEDIESIQEEHIKILGFKKNVFDYLSNSDVYVSFSKSEGLPISVIEALGSNLLVLLSDIPSHKEFFNIDKSYYIGEYFEDDNIERVLENLRKHLQMDNSNGQFQQKYLSSHSMMQEYEKCYLELLNLE